VVQTTVENGQQVTTRFSSPRAERAEGETTTFERGTYTACEPCKDNPERPPLWQVKAARIIHNNSEQTIYYEDASLELFGMPIAYLPYFWTPDPTVKRKTGFLAPRYVYSSSLGVGASLPFFWAIAPNYDLTVTPTFLSRQGVLGEAEWRHRLETGSYRIQAATACAVFVGSSSASGGFSVAAGGTTTVRLFTCPSLVTAPPDDGTGPGGNPPGNNGNNTGGNPSNPDETANVTTLPQTGAGPETGVNVAGGSASMVVALALVALGALGWVSLRRRVVQTAREARRIT
jgi:hypothetical protein